MCDPVGQDYVQDYVPYVPYAIFIDEDGKHFLFTFL